MKHIKTDGIVSVSASSEDPEFPAENVRDEHPKLRYKAAAGVWAPTLTLGIIGGVSDIMIAGTNATDVSFSAEDPNEIAWAGSDVWGGAMSTAVAAAEQIVDTSANIVDTFIYNTYKDSDGGAWRDNCESLSWYSEAASATRGSTSKFPAIALIVAETDTVTIYDATDSSLSMWMVFEGYTTTGMIRNSHSSVVMKQGLLVVGMDGSSGQNGMTIISFLKETAILHFGGDQRTYAGDFLSRNDGVGWSSATGDPGIVDDTVNDVAMTILPGSEIDSETGIRVPTIGAATDGGVSVIDGPAGVSTVVDIVWSSTTLSGQVHLEEGALKISHGYSGGCIFTHTWNVIPSTDLTEGVGSQKGSADRFYSAVYNAAYTGLDLSILGDGTGSATSQGDSILTDGAIGNKIGLTLLKENPVTPADGMIAYLTSSYLSGWMQGDIKCATLADTVAETIGTDITTEHVVNGDFSNPVVDEDWTAYNDAAIVETSGNLQIRGLGTDDPYVSQIITTVGDQIYALSIDRTVEDSDMILRVGTTLGGDEILEAIESGTGSFAYTFRATGASTYLRFGNQDGSSTCWYDNISVKATQSLIENGEFSSDRVWTKGTGVTIDSDRLKFSSVADGVGASQSVDWVAGKMYKASIDIASVTYGGAILYANGVSLGYVGSTGVKEVAFESTGGTGTFAVVAFETSTMEIESYYLEELQVPDRSVDSNSLQVVEQITKAAVNTGCDLVSYSGFSTDSYISQPYYSAQNPGIGDFHYLFWLKESANSAVEVIFERDSVTTAQRVTGQINADGTVSFICDDDTTVRTATSTGVVDDGSWHLIEFDYSSGTLNIYIDSELDGTETGAALSTFSNTSAILRIGTDVQGANPLTNGSLALFRDGHSIPSSDQLAEIYRTEKKLFEADATFLLPSDNVTALDYDADRAVLAVGTDAGVVAYRDLLLIPDHFDHSLSVSTDIVSVSNDRGVSLIGTDAQAYSLSEATYTKEQDIWANTPIEISGTVTQNIGANSIWLTLPETINISVNVSLVLSASVGATLYAGVARANIAKTYDQDPNYGLKESRKDYSIFAENSNGSFYYNKRDIVRTFNLQAFMRRTEAQELIDTYDTLGKEPSAWKLTSIDSNNWVVFGRFTSEPTISHDHPEDSIINWAITEVL